MNYLLKNEKLEIKYVPGNGAWTYHIQIPNSKHLKGKWGTLKVSGSIDGYQIEAKNLFTISGQDKLLSINQTTRKAINKSGGDIVNVTLYLLTPVEQITEPKILETFEELGVLEQFEDLPSSEKDQVLSNILSQKTEAKQIDLMVEQVDRLSK